MGPDRSKLSAGHGWSKVTMTCMLLMAFIAVALARSSNGKKDKEDTLNGKGDNPRNGKYPFCGGNPNDYVIDQTEPENPGPFHDLTVKELRQLRQFLEKDPKIRATKTNELKLTSSFVYTADLWAPKKADVLKYLDEGGPQPPRQARVLMFRGDLTPPVVEEYICGPLPSITKCELLNFPNRRNPVEFEVRPLSEIEFLEIKWVLFKKLDEEVGYILRESYNATFTQCDVAVDCFSNLQALIGTGISGDPKSRLMWLQATYSVPYSSVVPVDFALLVHVPGADSSKWFYSKIWYAGRLYQSTGHLIKGYNSKSIPIERITKPVETEDLFSTLHRRGKPWPPKPQRPPMQVEPDGKRYSLKNKQVEYSEWRFNFRLSNFAGPVLYDVRFRGERIAYELGLNELAVFYSGHAPVGQLTDYVDSGEMLGSRSKALIPGADCPENSTLVQGTFLSQATEDPQVYKYTFCLFEFNHGYPLRRHLLYDHASFYGGMLNSALILRGALVVDNYDYIIDFIFYQNGVLEGRVMSTGYILGTAYNEAERPYGFRLHDHLLGNLHIHLVNFKADLDILGTKNNYRTLNIERDEAEVSSEPGKKIYKTRFSTHLMKTEQEAVLDYDFEKPKYYVVQNDDHRTKTGETRGYRIQINGMAKNLVPPETGNEPTMAWGRHQLVVTKHKEEEFRSSSVYGFFDSGSPVVNFTTFYADNEPIVNEDLVFWITCGLHHIPHTEDLPVTPTVGNHLSFFLLPYNYFDECPSMGSRDAIYINHIDPNEPKSDLHVNRYGNTRDQCVIPRSKLEEAVKTSVDNILLARSNYIQYLPVRKNKAKPSG